MDYGKVKKEELIEKCKDLQEKLDETVHLKEAVEEKDKEIAKLIEQSKVKRESEVKEAVDKKVNYYEKEIQRKDSEIKRIKEDSKRQIEKATKEIQRRAGELNKTVFQYGALLKTLQGTLDTHLELNDFIVSEIKGGSE